MCVPIASSAWGRIFNNRRTRSDGTHVEHEKDPVEVRPPGGDLLLIILCVKKLSGCVPFALLDDLLVDIRDCSEARPRASSMRRSKRVLHAASVLTHVVSCPIASSRDWLRSLSPFPFNPP